MKTCVGFHSLIPLVYLLPLIILIEGFASIAVEILTIRQLLPVVGGSVVVTSLIIGVFLLFLALGYDWGGRQQERLEYVLRRNFLITAIYTGIGLSYVFITTFFDYVRSVVGHQVMYALIAYLLVVLAPIVFLLGQTLPITMNIVRQDRLAGAIAGKALGLSTVGSFLGAILTTVVLMHYLGVAITVFIVFLSLMVLTLLLSADMNDLLIKSLFSFFAGWLVFILNIDVEKGMFIRTTTYGNYEIIDQSIINGERYLIINNSYSSKINEVDNSGFDYIEAAKKVIFDDLKLKNADILVLGAGGFTLSQVNDFNFGNRFTYVDIDGEIKKIVVPGFVKKVDDELVIDDARHYVKATNKKYDVIFVDVFSDRRSIPVHLLTVEFMKELQAKIKKNGIVMLNIISNPTMADRYSKRVDNTIRSVFHNCTAKPIEYADNLTNILYVCSNKHDLNDPSVYTDDKNAATLDSFNW